MSLAPNAAAWRGKPVISNRAAARSRDEPLPLRFGGLDLDTLRRLVQYEVAEARALAAETKPGGLTHVDVPSTFP